MDTFTADTITDCIQYVMSAATIQQSLRNLIWNSPFNSGHLDDLKQDLAIYLMDKEEKTLQAAANGQLLFYFIAIAKRQIHSTKSKLWGRYINHQDTSQFDEFDESNESNIDNFEPDFIEQEHLGNYINDMLGLMNQNINTSGDLKRNLELLKMHYFNKMTYRQIQAKTNIPISNISKYINEARQWFRNNINGDLFI